MKNNLNIYKLYSYIRSASWYK